MVFVLRKESGRWLQEHCDQILFFTMKTTHLEMRLARFRVAIFRGHQMSCW